MEMKGAKKFLETFASGNVSNADYTGQKILFDQPAQLVSVNVGAYRGHTYVHFNKKDKFFTFTDVEFLSVMGNFPDILEEIRKCDEHLRINNKKAEPIEYNVLPAHSLSDMRKKIGHNKQTVYKRKKKIVEEDDVVPKKVPRKPAVHVEDDDSAKKVPRKPAVHAVGGKKAGLLKKMLADAAAEASGTGRNVQKVQSEDEEQDDNPVLEEGDSDVEYT